MVKQHYKHIPDGKRRPADPLDAGFLSILTFWWMNKIFKTGAERPLEESDFLPLQEEDDTERLTRNIQENWILQRKRCAESAERDEPLLWKSVLSAVSSRRSVLILFSGLVDSLCRVLQPLLVGYLVSGMIANDHTNGRSFLYSYAGAMLITAMVRVPAHHFFFYNCSLFGMQLKAAIKGVLYLKIFSLSRQTLMDFTTGQVVDLISNDVQRMERAPEAIYCICLSLFDITVSASLMWYVVGLQPLVGLASIALSVPFAVFLAHISGRLRKKTAEVTDRRVLLMNEVVAAIRAMKTNAWEWIYRDKIRNVRREELSVIRKKSVIMAILGGLTDSSSAIAVFVSTTLVVLTGHRLTPVNLFLVLGFMNVLNVSISYHIGFGLQIAVEAMTSLKRIQRFLLLQTLPHLNEISQYEENLQSELADAVSAQRTISGEDHEIVGTCAVSNVTLRSGYGNSYILHNIRFEGSQGSLVMLTGPVGSGKSSVLAAINKEVEVSEGSIFCSGTVAYVSQTPWIFPGTIRENILFGKEYDKERFKTVVEICALQKDLEYFPDGDETIVGERGIVISGGQQARVSLARAVYADADVYLLDDPLSAVDAKVGQHIFEECICDFLSTKTRLFVTHQINHMKMADQIVALSKGNIITRGSYKELANNGLLDTLLDINNKATPGSKKQLSRQDDESKPSVLLKNAETGLEIPEEDRSIGTVSLSLYWKYFRAGLPAAAILGLFTMFLLSEGLSVYLNVWLSRLVNAPTVEQRSITNIAIYTGLVCGALFFAMLRAVLFYQASLSSSNQLHDRMVLAILKAPVLFFDTNPIGRILNRFSKDVGCMDEVLPTFFFMSIKMALFTTSATLLPTVLNPWILLVVIPVCVIFIFLVKYYLKSSRELKRLESICCSPVFSHVSETLNGLDTIRSRGRQKEFIGQFYRHQNKHNQAFRMCVASVRWMGFRVDLLSTLIIGVVAFSAIRIFQDAAQVGLSLVYVIETLDEVQFTVQQTSEVENQMTSVERVMTYTEIEPEPGYDIDTKPPEDWPQDASIAFDNVSLRYYSGGPRVLRDLNINIESKAKIGVAGRTGAGKSSAIAALLRMPEAKGVITIDGINLATLNLQESRRCVSVLSQKPVLFSGPLRKNLDPLLQHKDADLWQALEDVQLKILVEHLEGQLDYEVSEGGGNFSVGERQLLCLARVLLQRNKVLILDEPTAHVDPTTERTIQNTVRDQLKECTVITVAHRLNTIRDCDKILVMKDGTAVEFDSCEELMKKQGGVFAEMAEKQS